MRRRRRVPVVTKGTSASDGQVYLLNDRSNGSPYHVGKTKDLARRSLTDQRLHLSGKWLFDPARHCRTVLSTGSLDVVQQAGLEQLTWEILDPGEVVRPRAVTPPLS